MRKRNMHFRLGDRLTVSVLLAVLTGSLFTSLIPTQASAASYTPPTSATWVNTEEIDSTDGTNQQFKEVQLINNNKTMVLAATSCRQSNGIKTLDGLIVGPNPNNPATSNDPDYTHAQSALYTYWSQSCTATNTGVHITDTKVHLDNTSDTSLTVGSGNWTATNPGQLTVTYSIPGWTARTNEVFNMQPITSTVIQLIGDQPYPSCAPDEIDIGSSSGGDPTTATIGTIVTQQFHPPNQCSDSGVYYVTFKSYKSAGGVIPSGTTTNKGECNVDNSFALRWVACPLINNLLIPLVEQVDNMIGAQLATDVGTFFSAGFENVFNTFRNLGIAILIVSGLVMVLSEASGLDLFAAYTIRKALPRIVIATIGMGLAWPLLQFTVTLFNDVGAWIGQIILSVTNTGSGIGVNGLVNLETGALITAIIGVVYTTLTLAFLSWGGFGLLILSAALLLLVALFVLALRQIVILLCIVTAPLAIACYVLPGTERVWKFWRQTLFTTLLMYPLIMAFLSAGAAMAYLTLSVPGVHPILGVLAIVMWAAPYVFIPFAFQAAGGVTASAAAFIHGRHRESIEGRLSQMRQHDRAHNWEQFQAGNSHHMMINNPLTHRGLNTLGQNVGAFLASEDRVGFLTDHLSRDAAIDRHMKIVRDNYARQPGAIATQNNDDMLHAQRGRDEAEARAILEDRWTRNQTTWQRLPAAQIAAEHDARQARIESAIAAAHAQGGFGEAQRAYAVEQLAANGTGYENQQDAARAIAGVAGGNIQRINTISGAVNYITKQAGRHDLAPGAAQLADLVRGESGLPAANTAPGGAAITPAQLQQMYTNAMVQAWNSASLYQHGNDKDRDMRNLIHHFEGVLNNATAPAATPQERQNREDAARFFTELQAMLPNSTGGVRTMIEQAIDNHANRRTMDRLLDPHDVLYLGDTPTVQSNTTGVATRTVVIGGTPYQVRETETVARAPERAATRVNRTARNFNRDPNLNP